MPDRHRYSLAALEQYCHSSDWQGIALRLDTEYRTLYRWAELGLNWISADKVACKLGTHVSMIWPEWWRNYDDGVK